MECGFVAARPHPGAHATSGPLSAAENPTQKCTLKACAPGRRRPVSF